jgi:predicted transcriptional regulator
MNHEMMKLKERIAELERMNAELLRENAALKAKPQKEKETQQGVDKTSEILQHFFNNPQNLPASQVAGRLNLTQSVAQYHIDRLIAKGFLTVTSSGNTTGYMITPRGREVVMGGAS